MFSGIKKASDNCSTTFLPEDQFVVPHWYTGQEEWICDPHNSDSVAYNYFAAVRLRGALRHDVLQASLDKIVRRHGVLRSIFKVENGRVSQIILEPQPVVIRNISVKQNSARQKMLRRPWLQGNCNLA